MDSNSPWKPTAEQISLYTSAAPKSSGFSWVSFGQIFAMVVETVALLAIDVLSAGTFVPANMAISGATAAALSVGVGIAGAATQAAISAADGSFSALNLGIDVAASIIPVGAEAFKGAKMLGRVTKNAEVLLTEAERLGKVNGKALDRLFAMSLEDTEGITKRDARIIRSRMRKFHQATDEMGNTETSLVETLVKASKNSDNRLAQEMYEGLNVKAPLAAKKVDTLLQHTSAFYNAEMISNTSEVVKNMDTIGGLESLYYTIQSGALRSDTSVFMSKSALSKALHEINPHAREAVIDSLFIKPKVLTKAKMAMIDAKKTMDQISEKILTPEQNQLFAMITQAAGHMRGFEFFAKASERHNNGRVWKEMFSQFENTLTDRQRKRMAQLITGGYKRSYEPALLENTLRVSKGLSTAFSGRRLVRFLGSAKFNRWGVQLAQLIDPNDAGRAPVEFGYQLFKKKYDKYLADKLRKINVNAKKYARGTWTLEQAFVKAGGTLIPRNRYIIGFKVLDSQNMSTKNASLKLGTAVIKQSLVLIKFNKINTGHKLHKTTVIKMIDGVKRRRVKYVRNSKRRGRNELNKDGKPDIIVRMTDEQILAFEEQGVQYWFDNGIKNGWMVSRGGRKSGTGYLQLTTNLSLFLTFIPISPLRNVLSITSNWVENVSAMSRGEYTEQWATKFLTSIERASINRAGRAVSNVVLGGLAKNWAGQITRHGVKESIQRMIGRNAGRELQRYTSASLHMFETTNSKGEFVWRKPTQGQVVGRAFGLSASTSLQSAVRRKARKNHSRAAQFQSFRTKGRQVRRIPGAITPNSVFTPRNFGSIKLK